MTAGVPAPAKQDRRTVVVGTRRPAQTRGFECFSDAERLVFDGRRYG